MDRKYEVSVIGRDGKELDFFDHVQYVEVVTDFMTKRYTPEEFSHLAVGFKVSLIEQENPNE
jgi:hypothetical protein